MRHYLLSLSSEGQHVVSPLYETEPVGVENQDSFYNAVVELSTSLDPTALRG